MGWLVTSFQRHGLADPRRTSNAQFAIRDLTPSDSPCGITLVFEKLNHSGDARAAPIRHAAIEVMPTSPHRITGVMDKIPVQKLIDELLPP
jgi:hypothetical protein